MHNTRWTKERTEYTRFELRMLPNKYILHHRHVIEEADILKCTGDATPENLIRGQATYRPAGKQNITRCWTVNTSYQVKDCRLSCTIGANNANNLLLLLLNTYFRFKARRFWYHIQRTHLHLFIFSVVQFAPSTRTWNEPFWPEDHNHDQDNTKEQVTYIAEGETGKDVGNSIVNCKEGIARIGSQRIQLCQ